MEFLVVLLIVGAAGGVLGFFAAKKYKSEKVRLIEGLLLTAALCLSVYAALEASKVYLVCAALLAGELIRIAIPGKKE